MNIDQIKNTIICGDCLEIMKTWPDGFIDCCVTSPPYWGLRDYGVEGQLGLEPTPEEFVAKMVEIFAEVKRVLKPGGTLWLNLGDSYSGGGRGCNTPKQQSNKGTQNMPKSIVPPGLKTKDLCGIPWQVAFALRQDGWYLRQDIIWHKPNPMPESVRDRCTKAHEYIFLLTKQPQYYYDQEAIKEEMSEYEMGRRLREKRQGLKTIHKIAADGKTGQQPQSETGAIKSVERRGELAETGKRNKRSVWTVTTKPYSEAHFATFPPDLITPCILAGCPEWACKKCGKARLRIVDKEFIQEGPTRNRGKIKGNMGETQAKSMTMGDGGKVGHNNVTTTGWTDCGCSAGFEPGIVLDPFMGSGTTAMVAYENRRNYIGCELNPEYIKLNRAAKSKQKYALLEIDQ